MAEPKLGFVSVQNERNRTIVAEPKPFLEPTVCGEWLASIG
jgi:hypothetical protein